MEASPWNHSAQTISIGGFYIQYSSKIGKAPSSLPISFRATPFFSRIISIIYARHEGTFYQCGAPIGDTESIDNSGRHKGYYQKSCGQRLNII